MKKKVTAKGIWNVLKSSFPGFGEYKIPKLSASLAYYTVFSMGPLLIVVIAVAGLFLGREAAQGEIYHQMNNFVGNESAAQMQEIVKNASIGNKGTIAMIIGIITLLIGATGVFAEIQDSINTIWGLKPKPKAGLWLIIKSRFLSMGMIVSLGFLLLVSLAVTTVVEKVGQTLFSSFADSTVVLLYIANLIVTLVAVTLLFAVIFKVLPDALIKWKQVWPGAIFTAVLFLIGKFLISFYIAKSDIGSTYGTAGSLVIMIIWIYYSAIILYFGAVFTKQYALAYGGAIHPNKFAVVVSTVEVEGGKQSLQQNEAKKGQVQGKLEKGMQPNPHPAASQTMAHPVKNEQLPKSARPFELYPHLAIEAASVPPPKPKKIKKVQKNQGPGMMKVLGGLLLFFITRSGNEKKLRKV